jgi:hypothetical protein
VADSIEATRAAIGRFKAECTNDGSVMDVQVARAVDARLRLRVALLYALESFARHSAPDTMRMYWRDGLELLDAVADSHAALAVEVPAAFSSKLQRLVAGNMPMRPVVDMTFEDGLAHARRLFGDTLRAIDVLDAADPQALVVGGGEVALSALWCQL